MANDIQLVTKYLPLLDEVYKQSAKTAILEAPENMVRATEDANVFKIAKLSFDGLGDYDKATGFPAGNLDLDWETHTFVNDRGRKFSLDRMDNLESLGMALLNVSGEFVRTKVVPEKDAYTVAKIAGTTGVAGTTGTLTNSNTKEAIDTAIAQSGEAEVDEANMILMMTPTVKGNLEAEINRQLDSGVDEYGQKINYYNDIPIIAIPQTRFYDKIDLQDGKTSGQVAGGYVKNNAGKDINFILMDKNAAFTVTKHALTKVITPEQNQMTDGWMFQFRFYYEAFVQENKKAGIYVHKVA